MWIKLGDRPWRIFPIGLRDWADVFSSLRPGIATAMQSQEYNESIQLAHSRRMVVGMSLESI
jgi:hypothetical protein